MSEFERITDKPPFTTTQLREAIPAHCFSRDPIRSISYVVRDFVLVGLLYCIAYLAHPFSDGPAGFLFFPLWWFAQGTIFWSLFVIGHDCGHGSFSESNSLNYFFGHICHTAILVPFHSWRLSHRKHHLNTGNTRHDESFIAVPKTLYQKMFWLIWLFRYHLFNLGWIPYLVVGMPLEYYCHFNPRGKIYKKEDYENVLTSVVFIFAFVGLVLVPVSWQFGLSFLFIYYLMPVLVFGAWIGLVTLLHHTHPDVPWYRDPDWSFLRGALSTVDRNYGIFEKIHHNIGTHVVHHLFMSIPHYHLVEATKAIKPILGNFYKKSELGIAAAIQKTWAECHYVEDTGSLLFYQKSPVFPAKEPYKKRQ